MGLLAPHASPMQATAWALMVFAAAALPGYPASILLMDCIGPGRLQMIGFAVMALSSGLTDSEPCWCVP